MKVNHLALRVLKIEKDYYGNSHAGTKSTCESIKGTLTMLKFMISSILTLQIILISVMIYFLSINHLVIS